jgi:hypothetical protein
MAEVIRDLSEQEKGAYMPFCELLDRERNEVYEAAGAYLLMAYEIDGSVPSNADLLIKLGNDTKIHFFFGESLQIDALQ